LYCRPVRGGAAVKLLPQHESNCLLDDLKVVLPVDGL
jgi:hypothetical protein